ncbi:EutN/CcmL family microcompartment protein [Puniceicoccus vermicola]|uniref:EutN/CcmL family microcompartment protein n=1 Tax=Puniceicoccus vermicola TaxID=388746 RepID=A0A7X1E7B0_9BACT|nr:EutN/CcmL family microcompartment protein [Puniceicoccus vermicola]MBC2603532.1 EutN/CcmL family microcompartment protein [Puniceicoccus vermicola]
MYLARVIGQVVASKKEEDLRGRRLLLLRPMLADAETPSRLKPGSNTLVAVDPIGAGTGEMVMFVQGSSARQGAGLKSLPIDASIIGIVDSVQIEGENVFLSSEDDSGKK